MKKKFRKSICVGLSFLMLFSNTATAFASDSSDNVETVEEVEQEETPEVIEEDQNDCNEDQNDGEEDQNNGNEDQNNGEEDQNDGEEDQNDGNEDQNNGDEDQNDGNEEVVPEESVSDDEVTEIETTTTSGTIIWNDNDNEAEMRPSSVTVTLMDLNEDSIISTQDLSEDIDWSYSFTDLPKYADDAEINYGVEVEEIENYLIEYGEDTITLTYSPVEVPMLMGYRPPTTTSTFDHIDIESEASFTYYVDGSPVKVNINFYNDKTQLSNIKLYKKNSDGSLSKIDVSGKWQNQSNSSNKEYRISGTFDKYYENSTTEVVYVVEFTMNVQINGSTETLVYTSEHSFSKNNVCPGSGSNKGIDVEITGSNISNFFSAALKIVKNVTGNHDGTFTFLVTGPNSFSKTVEITTINGTGSATIGGLTANQKYVIYERNIPDDYTLTSTEFSTGKEITAVKNSTVTATCTNAYDGIVTVSGTKTWVDGNNQDGIRPTSITVKLMNGKTVVDTKTVTANNGWKYSFTNLPKYAAGKEISYSITEDTVTGYTMTANGYNLTNTHTAETVTVSGTKTWVDNNNQDGIRPTSITVKLMNGKTVVDTKTVTANNGWKYSFTNLPKYVAGKEISYSITEDTVTGYVATTNGYNLTNTHTTENVTVSGTKTWADNNNQDGIRPESITVKLMNGSTLVDSKTVTADDDWKYSFTNLPKYVAGKEITYTITEETVDGYTLATNGFDLTNTHTPAMVTVSGTKTWVDGNNQDGIRPTSITVKLMNGSTLVDTVAVTQDTNWKYSFTNLPKYASGKEISYTLVEEAVKGYVATFDGNNITNTHTPETIAVEGMKTWNDADNQDGVRPESITVKLMNGDTLVSTLKVTAENSWKYSFTNLPKYANGKEIAYAISEEVVEGYSTTIEGFDITNTHTPATVEVTGTKTWVDGNNQDGIRPASIVVKIMNGKTVVDEKEVTSADNWTYSFTNLPKYAAGKEISYTLVEEAVKGYEATFDGNNITNTHTPETIAVEGTKTWNDADNQDGVRPESITVKLMNGDTLVSTLKVTAENNWKYSFTNLPKYADGKEIAYTITEEAVKGYETSYDGDDITNTHVPEVITISGTKTWNDENNKDGIRPSSITVILLQSVYEVMDSHEAINTYEVIDSIEITSKDNWTYSFTNLPKYADGKEIDYEIGEAVVNGYETSFDGYNITNTHTPKNNNNDDDDDDDDHHYHHNKVSKPSSTPTTINDTDVPLADTIPVVVPGVLGEQRIIDIPVTGIENEIPVWPFALTSIVSVIALGLFFKKKDKKEN